MKTSVVQKVKRLSGKNFKEAMTDAAESGWSITYTAEAFCVSRSQLRENLKRFGLRDLFKQQGQLIRQCRGGNQEGCGGWERGRPRFSARKPIFHDGQWWHPSEPTHHYLFEMGFRHG